MIKQRLRHRADRVGGRAVLDLESSVDKSNDVLTLASEPIALFRVARFDRVYISDALSMIPQWRNVIDAGLQATAPGGSPLVADFGDLADLPDR